ncbi:hypothetical protein O1W69_04235 [Chlamydia sp. 12-01]|uniref:hypothetical protein n=1 Tax=Chlamydia sp. 12-01 TaxID=3002742 RepID=UPI0035D41854
MKDKTDNNETEDLSFNTNSRTRAKADPNPALFTLTGTTITSTKTINMNNQNIIGLPAPRQDSDAVSLDYLKSNYVSKTDPNSGYLPTTGGTMTGNIDMSGHSIINIKMPEKPTGSNTLDPSAAATVQYVTDTANKVTNNPDINNAIQQISSVSSQISTIEAALGITPSNPDDPDTQPPPDTSQFVRISGSTMSGNLDMSQHTVNNLKTPTDAETKDAANVEYVQSKITTPQIGILGNTIEGSTTTVTDYFNWKVPPPQPPAPPAPTPAVPQPPAPAPAPAPAPSPAPTPPKPTTPPFVPLPPPGPTQPPTCPPPYVPPKPRAVAASSTSTGPTTTPTVTPKTDKIMTTPVTEKYLKIDDSDSKIMKILSTGILTLSVTANWTGGTTANISVILNPSTTTTSGSSSGSNSSAIPSNTDTVIYSVSALSSGQNLFCQIPIEAPSDLKLKFTPPTTGGSGGGSGSTSLDISSWSWQATLLPSTFPKSTP